MSTWVGLEIEGLSVKDNQNHYSTWFFKRGDRVRKVVRKMNTTGFPTRLSLVFWPLPLPSGGV